MKKGLCSRCNQNIAGEYKDISFTYLGMTVKISKDGFTCEQCLKELWIEGFEKNAKDFIRISISGEPTVNWPYYRSFFSEGRFSDRKRALHRILVDFGIFSLEPKGNWEIVTDGLISLNPQAPFSYFYFVNKKDAIEFARVELSDTFYGWQIRQISEVLEKEEVLRDLKK